MAICKAQKFNCKLCTTTQADILEHREEQLKGAEGRCGELAAALERARGELTAVHDDVKKLKARVNELTVGDPGAWLLLSPTVAGSSWRPGSHNTLLTTQTQGDNSALASRVEDAASMLTDKDTLELSVKRQAALVERMDRELKAARAQIEAKNEATAKQE